MKIYDISQEIFNCDVYPGDSIPKRKQVSNIKDGDLCNLSDFSMCAHNGTHVDAPYHFFDDGKTIDQLPLEYTVGLCKILEFSGIINAKEADKIMQRAGPAYSESSKRILIKGNAYIDPDGARFFVSRGIKLIGVEAQTVSVEKYVSEVHKILLSNEIVILEGIRLSDIDEDDYFLNAVPISLGGADGAPCRAILIKL